MSGISPEIATHHLKGGFNCSLSLLEEEEF
jgi:hypothetical protein